IVVTAPDGSIVPGALTLSVGNTKATFRPSAPLAANTAYTTTITTGFRNLGGHALAAPVVAHFSSVDTSAPAPPAAGSVTATIPDADGFTTITGTQGTAGTHDAVSIVNLTRRTSFPVLLDPNGGFSVRLAAGRGDTLQLVITGQNGTQTV